MISILSAKGRFKILLHCCFPWILPLPNWYLRFTSPECSLGDQFVPLAAYVPTGPETLPARVYAVPVELTMGELNNVDPFEDMVYTFLLAQV